MSAKVFFEPRISLHAPGLYSYERTADAVSTTAARAPEALERYRRDGFLLVRELLGEGEIRAGRGELENLALTDRPDCSMIWYEGAIRDEIALDATRDREIDGRLAGVGFAPGQEADTLPAMDPQRRARFVRKFMGFVDRQPALTALARHPGMLDLVRSLIGAEPMLFQDMALVKPEGGREKPWHQDHDYFNVTLDTSIVGVWIPFGAVTPDNGCMHMLAGGHRPGPRIHFKRRDWQICDSDIEESGRVAVPMQAGDVLFFDGKIPHGTPVNRTAEHRWAVQFHYRPQDAKPVDDATRLASFGSEGRNVTC